MTFVQFFEMPYDRRFFFANKHSVSITRPDTHTFFLAGKNIRQILSIIICKNFTFFSDTYEALVERATVIHVGGKKKQS